MIDDTQNAIDPRDVERGRLLNELFDAGKRGDAVRTAGPRASSSASAREMREFAGMLRDLGLASGRLDALIAHGILEKSQDPSFPARLGPYQIIEYVGRGGMGLVFKAYEKQLRRTIALKLLRPELCHDARAVERFAREAQAAAALNHPNIVTIHAVGEHAGVHYIAMEFVDGPSLGEAIKSCPAASAPRRPVASDPRVGRSPEQPPDSPQSFCGAGFQPVESAIDLHNADTIREIFRQLLEALAAAHDAGLIHRDIKSSNILLEITGGEIPRRQGAEGNAAPLNPEPRTLNPPSEPSFRVKLADFGLARMANSQTRMTATDSILGTPEYMSPEQARGDADIDRRTDLYSAGVVLYEMLTGRTPFKADTPTSVIHQILNVAPPAPELISADVDPVLASIALRLMAKEPGERFASAFAVLRAIEANRYVQIRRSSFVSRIVAATLTLLGLGAAGMWLNNGFGWNMASRSHSSASRLDAGKIVDARARASDRRRIEVCDGNDEWRAVDWLIPKRSNHLKGVRFIKARESENPTVVAGLHMAQDGSNLIGFDLNGRRLWGMHLHSMAQWPDGGPLVTWNCVPKLVGNLNGAPGDEAAVLACGNSGYACQLAVIDPRRGEIISTFWHMGNLDELWLEPDFFKDGGAALIAWGLNNKLDGFDDDELADRLNQPTHWDYVPVIAVLNPLNMDGVGPPSSTRIDFLKPASPYAYACLDMAGCKDITQITVDGKRRPDDWEVAKIGGIREAVESERPDFRPWKEIKVVGPPDAVGGEPRFRAALTVDRDLKLIHAAPAMSELGECAKPEFWEKRWIRILPTADDDYE